MHAVCSCVECQSRALSERALKNATARVHIPKAPKPKKVKVAKVAKPHKANTTKTAAGVKATPKSTAKATSPASAAPTSKPAAPAPSTPQAPTQQAPAAKPSASAAPTEQRDPTGKFTMAEMGTISKADAGYVDVAPPEHLDCDDCKHFRGPNACHLVAGEVSPEGLCKLFKWNGREEEDADENETGPIVEEMKKLRDAPDCPALAMGARRMDWMPAKQYEQMQKGLKKAVAARKKGDKAAAKKPAPAIVPPQRSLLKPAQLSSASHPSAPMKAPSANQQPGAVKLQPKSTLKIESKDGGMKIHVQGPAAKAAPGAVRHIVNAVAPHMADVAMGGPGSGPHQGQSKPVTPMHKAIQDARKNMPTDHVKIGPKAAQGKARPTVGGVARAVGSAIAQRIVHAVGPHLADEPVIDNRKKRRTNPTGAKAPHGSAPAPLKSIGPIKVAPSQTAPVGGGAAPAAAPAAGGGK